MKVINYKLYNEIEFQSIYTGVNEVEGEWIATTCGNPLTRVSCEDAEAYDTIELIENIIAGETGACEFCEMRNATAEDVDYVNEWLDIWGIR